MSTADIALARQQEGSQGSAFPWLVLLSLAVIPLFGTSVEGVQRLLLLAQAIFFFLGMRRPVWILAALLISELTIANYMYEFGSLLVSNRLIITLASIPVVLPYVMRRPDLGPRTRSMVIAAFGFFLVATFANMVAADGAYVLKFARYLATGLIALVLVPAVVYSRDDLRDLALVGLVAGAVSALVAVLQHYSQFTGAPLYQAIPHPGMVNASFESFEGRSLGLTESPIHLTNALLFVGMPLLGVILLGSMQPRIRLLLTVILLLTAAALFFTFTRSWTFSAGAALLPVALLYRGRYWREFVLLALLAVGAFWYWSDSQANRYTQGVGSDSSAATRPVLWEAALDIALDHPYLGVGHNEFLKLSPEYASRIEQSLLERHDAGTALGRYEPHNDFLNVWLSFGSGALVLYLAMMFMSGKNYVDAFLQTGDPFLKGLSLGGLGALFAFAVNSSFHNLFDSTLTVWLLAGLSLALTKIVIADTSRRQRPPAFG